jgi:hypothetical protein
MGAIGPWSGLLLCLMLYRDMTRPELPKQIRPKTNKTVAVIVARRCRLSPNVNIAFVRVS